VPENTKRPIALLAAEAPPRPFRTNYPEPFASRMAGRGKWPLGDLFGLTKFGVNITRHAHTKQDEFIYILEGRPTLVTDAGRTPLNPGMCAGFKAGSGDAHCLINETGEDVGLSRNRRSHRWRRRGLSRRRPGRGDGRWQASNGS
jgi:uncharacterized cupin superfamily protein